jgi:hypothetical protein
MTRRSAAPLLALSLVCAACGPALLKLPSGPGVIALDAREALDAASAACRPLSAVSLEIAVSGSIGGSRVRGRLLAGLTPAGAVRLEAVAPVGQPVFVLTNGMGFVQPGANLLLPRDNRVLQRGQFDTVLEAVTGIPLDAPVLFSVLTGCAPGSFLGGNALGDDWRLVSVLPGGQYDVYVHRGQNGSWRLVATLRRGGDSGWRVEYANFQEGLPRQIRLVSARAGAFDLQMNLSQVELNPTLGPEVFTIQIPASATPISLDELKTSGPLGANGR